MDLRFNSVDLAVLEPSIPAIELAAYLDKPEAWLADYRRAARPFEPTETEREREVINDLRKSREYPPSEREDLIKKVRAEARDEQRRVWRECRRNAKRWIKLVRAYECERARLHVEIKSPRARKLAVHQMADGMRRAWANQIEAEDREEERRRARNRKATKKAARQNRKAFGYRGGTDGCDSEFSSGGSYRKPATPMTPDGQVDVEAMVEAEMRQLFAGWKNSGVNHGVEVLQGLESEDGDQWSVTEQLRAAKRLTEEAHKYKAFKRSRSV